MYGKTLRKRRKKLGLKQNELAQMIGITNGRLCQIENTKTRPESLAHDRIESALDRLEIERKAAREGVDRERN